MSLPLTKEQRDRLPESSFAVPGKRSLPIHDARHVRMAWSQLSRTQGLSSGERKAARARILMKAHELGIDTSEWEIHAVSYTLAAMSLDVPVVDGHPNRMPFSGVLTRVDEPSDNPPHGSSGKRTFIPKSVAEDAVPSLLGMAIDYTEDFDGHNRRAKIGVITAAEVVGNAIHIAGFLYASDFPEECARIKDEKHLLGFSYECQAAISDPDADPWVVTRCTFTGAAVLYKHLAAYTTTSLAAKADTKDFDMTPEELKAALEAAVAPIAAQVGDLTKKVEAVESKTLEASGVRDKIKPHIEAVRNCAAAMEAAGIGIHATQGHVNVLRHMAASMEAEAAMGNIPHVYRDHDYLSRTMDAGAGNKPDEKTEKALKDMQAALESAQTELKDLQAKAFKGSTPPERKTIDASAAAILRKYDLTASAEEGKLTVDQVDKALANLPRTQRIAQKLQLQAAGLIQ